MAALKRDYLRECMSDVGNPPLDQFQEGYCVHCQNPECARSGANNFRFNKRVGSWRETLFESPPRAAEDDPKFDKIRRKPFALVQKGPAYEVRRTGEVPVIAEPAPRKAPAGVPRRFEVTEEPEAAPEAAPVQPEVDPAPIPVQTAPVQTAPVQTAPAPVQPEPDVRDVANTPFTQGTVLPGGEKEQVEEPGSTYVFGDD